ncbi:hypothetical protein F8M41_007224 [Gigaspora margarita]|uniref:Uncharacterized protein n=1 Tax=Gigaspora margarita TaxID=4874 RepID=A0A8H4A4I8_GIGMA|nr:hypothetical protein F8M41_007224 [Gigaspora margarita]
MSTDPTPQNISCLKTLALNVLKNSSPEKLASNINIPELDPYKISNKKAKKPVKKKSHILKDLIKELSTEPGTPQDPVTRKENAVNFNDLYNNITNAEAQNKILNRDVIT